MRPKPVVIAVIMENGEEAARIYSDGRCEIIANSIPLQDILDDLNELASDSGGVVGYNYWVACVYALAREYSNVIPKVAENFGMGDVKL